MNTYEIHFIFEGKAYIEQITTTNSFKARQLIKGRYHGCSITRVQEI